MVFGYLIVQRLLVLARVLGRLPDPVSRVFARALNAATGPFHNHNRMGARLDHVIAALQGRLGREHDDAFCRGMHYPTRWDPFFNDYMTLEDIYRYPGQHFDFHVRQLTVSSATG